MRTEEIVTWARDKERFTKLRDYTDFAREFLAYRDDGSFQAELVSRNTPQYLFLQYPNDADFKITRPINSNIFYTADEFDEAVEMFEEALDMVFDDDPSHTPEHRDALSRVIYTSQQSIGAALDGLPGQQSNAARKVNGDLFERFIGLSVNRTGVDCTSGVLKIPINDDNGDFLFNMSYQHDLMVKTGDDLRAIGSVKTSSKDRIDKVFVDKFLYNRLKQVDTPHFAIFLHDVQRAGKEPNFRTSNTFLPGHFKGYTVKLNPLDGVYYCDLLPAMTTDPLLAEHIDRIDKFFVDDLPEFVREADHPDVTMLDENIVEATDD